MVCKAAHRMCPPPRSLALEANGCFMVWVQPDPTEYKVAARGFARHGGLCAGHARQPGGESPLCNLMEVKHE